MIPRWEIVPIRVRKRDCLFALILLLPGLFR